MPILMVGTNGGLRCDKCGLLMPIFWPRFRCVDTEACQERVVAQFADNLDRKVE